MEIRESFIGRVSRRARRAAELVGRVLGEQEDPRAASRIGGSAGLASLGLTGLNE